jgi:hypothetical protein
LGARDAEAWVGLVVGPALPKVFAQRQLLSLLVLREYTTTLCRGTIELLAMLPQLSDAIGLERLP